MVMHSRAAHALGPQSLEIPLQSLLLAIVGHVNDHPLVDVVNDRHVLMPLLEGRLVHADLPRRLLLAPCQPSLDGSRLDPRDLVPR